MGKSNISYLDWVFNAWTGCSGDSPWKEAGFDCKLKSKGHTLDGKEWRELPWRKS